jgi:hypothetical protein
MLRRELQQAKSRQLSHALDQTSEVTPAGTLLQTLKPFIGPTNLKKQKKTGLPAVRMQNGSICTTPEEAQNRWIEFFSHLEGGTRMDHETYRAIWRQNLAKFLASDSFSIAITELPSLAELETAYRRVPFGKAAGNDGIPPEVCHVKARDLARLTYAILIKVFVYGQEAIEHKGGRLAVAWKHRGDVRDCDTHRSLLVSSHMGKTIHRALRQKHHGLYTAYMQTQQLGGRPKIPVGIPLHLSRAFMRWQARLQRPTACIFLDLAEAFYRLIRPLALGGIFLMMTLQSLLPGLALEIMLCTNFMHNSRSLQLCSRLELHQLYRSSSKLCIATHGSKLEPKMMSCEQQSALGRETRMQT